MPDLADNLRGHGIWLQSDDGTKATVKQAHFLGDNLPADQMFGKSSGYETGLTGHSVQQHIDVLVL